jgi:anti-sigma factor RsiW
VKTVELTCREVWKEISNYLDGDVDGQFRAELEAHFQRCARCTAVVESTRNVVKLIGEEMKFPLPEGFGERLQESIK